MTDNSQITRLLNLANEDSAQWDAVTPLVYQQLKRMAHQARYQHRTGDTLNTTALVHDAFLKLSHNQTVTFESRQHFYRIAARSLRQIMVDAARAKLTAKRNGQNLPFDDEIAAPNALPSDEVSFGASGHSRSLQQILDIDAALNRLAGYSERLVEVVEGHFYAGFSFSELALLLQVSERTVMRDWNKARAWLHSEMSPSKDS